MTCITTNLLTSYWIPHRNFQQHVCILKYKDLIKLMDGRLMTARCRSGANGIKLNYSQLAEIQNKIIMPVWRRRSVDETHSDGNITKPTRNPTCYPPLGYRYLLTPNSKARINQNVHHSLASQQIIQLTSHLFSKGEKNLSVLN